MRYLPYAMELARLTGIILVAALLFMMVMVTAPKADTDEPDDIIGVLTGAGAKLAAQYAPLAPAGQWYDGILHWWDNWSPGFPPDMFWWLEAPEPEPVKAEKVPVKRREAP